MSTADLRHFILRITMADIEPLTSARRHLRWLAAQYDEMAAELDTPQAGPTIAAD